MVDAPTRQQYSILIHYGEVGLKGKNQPQFRRQLRDNVRSKLRSVNLDWPVEETMGLLAVHVPAEEATKVDAALLRKLQQVCGIAWLARAQRLPHHGFRGDAAAIDFDDLHHALIEMARAQFAPGKTFAVRAGRGDKRLPFTTPELERRLGGVLIENTEWKKVNLTRPDVTFQVDLRQDASFLFSEKIKGPGGLPTGIAGRVLALLSGGIDSPVAAYLMAKRGCRVDFIHFTVTHAGDEELRQDKVFRLAQRLGEYTLGSRVFFVPYTYFDLALTQQKVEYDLILFRRFMARCAQQLARRLKAQALVSGDNLSQVASQTLSNLVSTSRATELPILRPLLGHDKEEIITLAKKIGTYEDSIEPYKDCCALISRHPRTSSKHDELVALEDRLFPEYQDLIDQTLKEAVCLQTGVGGPSVSSSSS